MLLGALVLLSAGMPGPAHARGAEEQPYIVVYEDSVRAPGAATQRRERTHGFRVDHRYGQAVKGFAARLSPRQMTRLRDDHAVAAVVPDGRVRASDLVRSGETVPTGVRRIGAATATTVRGASGARVAVLDTGIDLDHPDLNVTDGVNCTGERRDRPAQDGDGHGTHVAGIIGARNDGAGVVGVAPGTEVIAVKVLGNTGEGRTSDLICGIDWVTATRTDDDPGNDVTVANLSLSAQDRPIGACPAPRDPLHAAICRSTAAGVSHVAAAGNGARPFDSARRPTVPAAYPEVLTVTAMSDTDGEPGRRGPRGCSGEDVRAPFSNFAATAAGRAHTLAAPGSCIRSTRAGGGIARRGGTSMAAPHVAGLVALCHDEGGVAGLCSGRPPRETVERFVGLARAHAFVDGAFGFVGDPRQGDERSLEIVTGHLVWGGADFRRPAPVMASPEGGGGGPEPAGSSQGVGSGSSLLSLRALTRSNVRRGR